MFALIEGVVAEATGTLMVVVAGGLGYEIQCTPGTSASFRPGEQASLVLETRFREDGFALYGFRSREEREWFRTLTAVQGVGPRTALSLLEELGQDGLHSALATRSVNALVKAHGVGRKIAERIVAELADRVALLPAGQSSMVGRTAVAALESLGFVRRDAESLVAQALRTSPALGPQELVKAALAQRAGTR